MQNPPNNGTLTMPRPLGVDVGMQTGFDIAGARDAGYLITNRAGRSGSTLYAVDLASGDATRIGRVGRRPAHDHRAGRLAEPGALVAGRRSARRCRTRRKPRICGAFALSAPFSGAGPPLVDRAGEAADPA